MGLGYRLYESDGRARALMHTAPEIVEAVKATFGGEAYDEAGQLNRPYLAKIVFNDPAQLTKLNQIVHPATARDFEEWVAQTPADYDKQLVFKEAAILYESGADSGCDDVLMIYAPKSVRLARVMKRDGTTPEAILARMDKQWSDLQKVQQADWTLINDGTHAILPQLAAFLKTYTALPTTR